MPLSFIRWPASTKNGTASSGKLWLIDGDLLHANRHRHAGVVTKKTKPAMPVAKATGMPATISTTKTIEISSMSGAEATDRALGGSRNASVGVVSS